MKKAARSLLLVVAASTILFPVCASQNEEVYERGLVQIRAAAPVDSSAAAPTELTTAATSAQAPTSAAATSSPTAASPSSAAPTTGASPSSAVQSTASKGASSTPTLTIQPVSSAVATTDSSGQVITSYIEFTPTPSSAAPSHTDTSSSSSGDSGGLGTGSIVGLSVAGGIAAIAIILFFVWKFTRKRFADFDDNEAIKWPELNAHNNDVHALPTNATGRAGFGLENDSDINLTRAPSPGTYANSIAASSVPEAYGAGDPYAVPPLPHLNPNQPYHDDPGAYGQPAGYYDPYRGSVPNTFVDTMADGHPESIPMTQMARMRSPGPPVYDMQGRGSPAPQAAMGYPSADERSRTPTSVAVSAGRASPSPYGPR